MSDPIREAFEARFTAPLIARWDADKRCYYTVHGDIARRRVIEKYNARWEAWQAALAMQDGVGTGDMAAHSLTARLDTALEFLRHVKKCLVRNGEYAPLSHQELDSIIGIHPPASAQPPTPAVPADWKLVPVGLTPEMYNAFGYVKEVPFVIWKKVLAAAPAAPVVAQEPVAWTWQGALDELKGYCPDGVAVFGHKGPGTPLPLYTAPPAAKLPGTVEVSRHTLARYADHLQTAGYNNAADDLRTLLAGAEA